MSKRIELVRGSDNPFRDLKIPQPDTELIKADLAAAIIAVLDRRKLSIRKAAEITGIAHSDIARIRSVDLDRFTIDRLVRVLNKLSCRVEVRVRDDGRQAA